MRSNRIETSVDWASYFFDNPVNSWGLFDDIKNPGLEDTDVLKFSSAMFKDFEAHTSPYSASQKAAGIWNLLGGVYFLALRSNRLDLDSRLELISSWHRFFTEFVPLNCENALSYQKNLKNPLNGAVFMWWEILPIHGQADEGSTPIDMACLNLMKKCLEIPSLVCQESGLHGLAHWVFDYPIFVTSTIKSFIERGEGNAPFEILDYARYALHGDVQ
jgi:hypothetical protein